MPANGNGQRQRQRPPRQIRTNAAGTCQLVGAFGNPKMTKYDRLVRKLGLDAADRGSLIACAPLRQWAKTHRRREYVPEWLLDSWNLSVFEKDSIPAFDALGYRLAVYFGAGPLGCGTTAGPAISLLPLTPIL
jgi:hypothetical protein